MKIVAFGASNSQTSINKQLAIYAAGQFTNVKVEILDLNDYPLPIYSIDTEKESGIPTSAVDFYNKLHTADLVVVSLAEHNGSYTAVFKNLLDWMSRHETKTFAGLKFLLLSTSPGARGGAGVMAAALDRFPRHGAEIVAHFSLPFFSQNFDSAKGLTSDYQEQLNQKIKECEGIRLGKKS